MTNRLLDLWLEGRVLLEETFVSLAAKLCMLVHVFNLRCWCITSTHEARSASLQFSKFVEVVTHIFTLVQDIHHLLNFGKLLADFGLVQIWLHQGVQLFQFSFPKRS